MKEKLKVRTQNGKLIASILIWTGTAVTGSAYTPVAKVPQPEVIEQYIPKTAREGYRYSPQKSPSNWSASERRKREIINKIVGLRTEIRNKAESLQLDEDTIISGYTAQQKVHIHSTKLMMKIAANYVHS